MATVMLKNTYVGYLMLFGNYISCFIMSLMMPPAISKPAVYNSDKTESISFGGAIKKSLEDATKTCINIAGFVIIFSVIIYIVNNMQIYRNFVSLLSTMLKLDGDVISALFLGTIEITNGCNILAQTKLSMVVKASLASFLCSFSGFSIIAQVHSFTYKYKCFSFSLYTIRKFIQGVISALITYIVCYFSIESIAVFNNSYPINKISLLPFTLLLIISLIIYTAEALLNGS